MSETLDQFAARLGAEAGSRLAAKIYQAVGAQAKIAERDAKLNATQRLRRRTGHLARSISGTHAISGDAIVMRLRAGGPSQGADVAYARAQEYGATITAQKRFLAIPVGPALTAAGVARYPTPRAVEGLRFQPTRGGRQGGFLVRDVGGRNARSEVWYRLVRSVRIGAKRYLRDAFEASRVQLVVRVNDAVTASLRVP